MEFYKNGIIYEKSNVNSSYLNYEEQLSLCLADDYELIFDTRKLFNITGKSGTLVLENDHVVPDTIVNLKSELYKYAYRKPHTDINITSLHPSHFDNLKDKINGENGDNDAGKRVIKNILMDSMFQNRNQLKYAVIKCFADFTDLNFFIISRGQFLDKITNELNNYMGEYPVRNSYYKNFNELTFTLLKNNFYEVELDEKSFPNYIIEIKYDMYENKVYYGKKFKWVRDKVYFKEEIINNNKDVWDL